MGIYWQVRVVLCISSLDLLTWMHLYVEESVNSIISIWCIVMIFLGGSNAAMASLVMAQTLIMVCVFCSLRHNLSGWVVEQFNHDVAWAKIHSLSSTTIELISDYLDQSKDSVDEIELSIWLLLPMLVSSICYLSTKTKLTKTSSECICYVDGITTTPLPTKTSWETDKTQLLRLIQYRIHGLISTTG